MKIQIHFALSPGGKFGVRGCTGRAWAGVTERGWQQIPAPPALSPWAAAGAGVFAQEQHLCCWHTCQILLIILISIATNYEASRMVPYLTAQKHPAKRCCVLQGCWGHCWWLWIFVKNLLGSRPCGQIRSGRSLKAEQAFIFSLSSGQLSSGELGFKECEPLHWLSFFSSFYIHLYQTPFVFATFLDCFEATSIPRQVSYLPPFSICLSPFSASSKTTQKWKSPSDTELPTHLQRPPSPASLWSNFAVTAASSPQSHPDQDTAGPWAETMSL